MRHFDETVRKQLEDQVTDAESRCLLEIVVRVTPRSDRYRDAAFAWAILAGLVALGLTLFAPIDVPPLAVLPNVLVAGLVFGWLGLGAPGTKLLTSARRRGLRSLDAARACFVAESVSATRERTGVLVYASALEDLILVLPDHGAEGAAPRAEWEAVQRLGQAGRGPLPDRLVEVLTALGELGARHLPATDDDDNPDELPNAPIIG